MLVFCIISFNIKNYKQKPKQKTNNIKNNKQVNKNKTTNTSIEKNNKQVNKNTKTILQ